MIGIVITGHGSFATGVGSMISLVLGEQGNVRYVDFLESHTTEDISGALSEGIRSVDVGKGVVVMADLAGGTPFNTAVMLQSSLGDHTIRVIGGVNIPMVLQGIELAEDSGIEGIVAEIIAGAVDGIVAFEATSGNAVASDGGSSGEGI